MQEKKWTKVHERRGAPKIPKFRSGGPDPQIWPPNPASLVDEVLPPRWHKMAQKVQSPLPPEPRNVNFGPKIGSSISRKPEVGQSTGRVFSTAVAEVYELCKFGEDMAPPYPEKNKFKVCTKWKFVGVRGPKNKICIRQIS